MDINNVNAEKNMSCDIFISYSHTDLVVAEKVEIQLEKHGFGIWRDQNSLYAGTRWPRELGKKIAEQDAVLLLWSEAASKSDFVEMEWCTSVALKKQIIPVLLDATPLPDFLISIHGISILDDNFDEKIVQALNRHKQESNKVRTEDVLTALTTIEEKDPEKVLKAARSVYEDRSWVNLGQVYSAGRDINVTNIQHTEAQERSGLLQKWQTWTALIVGLLTLVGILIDLPQKLEPYFKKLTEGKTCDLTIALTNNSPAELQTSILIIEGKGSPMRLTVPVSAEIPVTLEEIMYNGWTPSIVWANGDKSVFAEQQGCTGSYQGESTDNLVSMRINAR